MVLTIPNLKDEFNNKKVFVSGHTGFKGAWLISLLNLLGARVKGYALEPDSNNSLFNLIDGNSLCESVIADIRDNKTLAREILNFQPDYIFHLAAQPLVSKGYQEPKETYEVNVMGTMNVLDSLKIKNFHCTSVIITTDKVYKNIESNHFYNEDDRLGGKDPYSSSKACAELVVDAMYHSYFDLNNLTTHNKKIATARSGNVIGGGDWAENRLVPDFIQSIKSNSSLSIRNPNSIRPWQHVLDPLIGYLLLAVNLNKTPHVFSQPFNFGPYKSDCISVENVIDKCINLWGGGTKTIDSKSINFKESGLLMLDIEKANNLLHWNPLFNLDNAIKMTLDWYRVFEDNPSRIKNFTFHQINETLNIK
jgi:CDP-glucose 4,6-dehydratase